MLNKINATERTQTIRATAREDTFREDAKSTGASRAVTSPPRSLVAENYPRQFLRSFPNEINLIVRLRAAEE